MSEYNLFYRRPDGTVEKAPCPIYAGSLKEAEAEGRQILEWAGGASNVEIPGWSNALIEVSNQLMGLPVFDHAELTAESAKKRRKGLCEHNVAAKYCRACK